MKPARRAPVVAGEILVEGGLGVPGAIQRRDLSRMIDVSPTAESRGAPACRRDTDGDGRCGRPLCPWCGPRCSQGFLACTFGPAHVHGAGKRAAIVSPACARCASLTGPYDETGLCAPCAAAAGRPEVEA